MAEAERLRAPQRAVDELQRPAAALVAVLAGEQRDGVHAAAAQGLELIVDRVEVGGLAHQGAVVAPHAAHAALGVAGVGQVERRERLEPDRPRPRAPRSASR